jgi:pimeloyl-ACP methyl ester carboxylesterase
LPHARHDGIRIYYEVDGTGPPLVLQHGFTSSLRSWYHYGYVKALRQRYRLILVDARGHGASDKPHDPAAYDPPSRAGDVVAVLDDLCLDAAHFWGYSMGGRIGFALAKYAPQRLRGLIVGGMHAFERRSPESGHLNGADADAFIRSLMKHWNTDLDALSQYKREELLANDFQALVAARGDEPSMEEILPGMTMPCLLYAGDRDAYCLGAQRCAQVIPHAIFVTLPGLDHGSAFHRAPLVVPHAMEFLGSPARPPAETP